MNIIEREIKEREDIIGSVDVKASRVEELEKELATIKHELSLIDVDALTAEIEELKTYLPKPEVEVTEGSAETVIY